MTRFARAKGSKSSNEKVPEEATPWSQLKKGMIMKQEALSEETKKCVSALKSKTNDKMSTEWVNLDDENYDSLNILKKNLQRRKKVKANLNCDEESCIDERKPKIKKSTMEMTENMDSQIKKKKKKGGNECEVSSGEIVANLNKKAKKGKKVKLDGTEYKNNNPEVFEKKKVFDVPSTIPVAGKKKIKRNVPETAPMEEINKDKVQGKSRGKKRRSGLNSTNSFEEKEQETEILSKKKKMKSFAGEKSLKKDSDTGSTCQSNITNKFKYSTKDKKKFIDNKLTINIGGEMVDLVKFQGFYITKEDGQRLKELRKKMAKEGISESQIESAIKLERRRCEKALARMKKNVCFQCRKPGHVLSQCPEVQDTVDTSTGICYKCGSTEHKAFSCKAAQGVKFPFAECFICKEKGHIARECPDNPRGLYPKGGCCKLCGDVTHLKKDCSKRISEMEESTIKLGLRDNRNLEGLDDVSFKCETGSDKKQKKRPVQF